MTREPLPPEIAIDPDVPELTPEWKNRLLDFNINYQLRGLRYFARLKLDWEEANPGKKFSGLCAEVNSITGRFRPRGEQRAWSWGDTRGLGIWCYFLQKGRVPDEEIEITLESGDKKTVNLRAFYEDYCDHIYTCLVERIEKHDGKIPFLVDVDTNLASDDPRNIFPEKHQFIATHVFAINAFLQYGMLRNNKDALQLGLKVLRETFRAAHENRFVNHLTRQAMFQHTHGTMMVSVGALVDALKTVELLERQGNDSYSYLKDELTASGRWAFDMFCGYHWDPNEKKFSEYLHPVTKLPYENDKGRVICDPGHLSEGVGFFSEYREYLPKNEKSRFRFNRDNSLNVLVEMLKFAGDNGFSAAGVMYKNIDLKTMQGSPDTVSDGVEYKTAPWWNVREMAAAAIKLYQATGHGSMWEIYKKAFRATYRNYPNMKIGGLMVQTLDAETLEPLPFHPATGNLDPMHSPRAREREIEALEKIGLE